MLDEPSTIIVEVDEAFDGSRLDVFLARRLPDFSRARLQALVRGGHLRAHQQPIANPAFRVKRGDRFELVVPPPEPAAPQPEPRALEILYEDEHVLVLVKPAGVVVHPAPGHAGGTLVNALLAHCGESLSGIGGVARPGIVHRLDREVSGVLVVAKSDRAHMSLAGQFTVHSVERVYEGIVRGVPEQAQGVIDRPIGRHPRDRKRMAVVAGGKRAVSRFRLLEAAGRWAARLEVRLETGRTHQIRVHLASVGHPLIGDRLYGRKSGRPEERAVAALERELDRILLHARLLGFDHPVTGERLRFEVPPPALFAEVLERLRMAAAEN
jgi:23S rRNA pseudouridine1911/1915/1917 synthase